MRGSDVTENPKGGITDNLGKIQREDHSNLLAWKMKTWGDRESRQMLLGGITSVK